MWDSSNASHVPSAVDPALDRVLVAISINPALGKHMSGSALLQHIDTGEAVRVNYFVTTSDIVVVIYVEA